MNDVTNEHASRRSVFWFALAIFLVAALGLVAYLAFSGSAEPVPPEVASNPTLSRGFAIYQERCVNCHGLKGRGDGTLASHLTPRPRNLVEEPWKYGDRPDQVLHVLAEGVKDSQMPAWGGTFGQKDLNSVAAYCYHLARKPIPTILETDRQPTPEGLDVVPPGRHNQ